MTWADPPSCPTRTCKIHQIKGQVINLAQAVIPDEHRLAGRDPWFDRLTTLSEVEGESSQSPI